MSYLDILKFASPEAVITLTALIVLAVGLATKAKPPGAETVATRVSCSIVALLGIVVAIGAILLLPRNATLFHGMLVISPLTSLFKGICLILSFFPLLLTQSERSLQHYGEYVALLLFAAVGLMLLVGSEELLVIFIGLELLGLSLYVITAF